MTLREIYEARQEEALMDKLASVADAVGDNPEFVEALDSALDVVKEAGVTDPEEQLDAAVELAVAYLSDEDDGFDKEAAAEEAYDLGKFAAFVAPKPASPSTTSRRSRRMRRRKPSAARSLTLAWKPSRTDRVLE